MEHVEPLDDGGETGRPMTGEEHHVVRGEV